jgi:hypothetical protein
MFFNAANYRERAENQASKDNMNKVCDQIVDRYLTKLEEGDVMGA